jgi:hypothetical protein
MDTSIFLINRRAYNYINCNTIFDPFTNGVPAVIDCVATAPLPIS